MRILVTGANGFLGSHLVDRLLADGHQILSLDRSDLSIPDSPATRRDLIRVTGQIEDKGMVEEAFSSFRPEAVAHLAAAYRNPDAWRHHIEANVLGTIHVLRAAATAGANRFLFFQTGLTYGVSPRLLPVPLDHPQEPDTSYTITKATAERFVELSGLDFVTLRLPAVYGPRMAGGPLVIFYKALREGTPFHIVDARRDFTFVDDVIDLATMALEGTGHGAYNVGSGSDRSVRDLFDIVAKTLGVADEHKAEVVPLPDGEPRTLLLDPEGTAADFGWSPTVSLEEGVPRAISWYDAHGTVKEPFTHLGGRFDARTRPPSLPA